MKIDWKKIRNYLKLKFKRKNQFMVTAEAQ